MRVVFILLALVGPIMAIDEHIDGPEDIYKQKFLFEIVYRVEDPLMFEEYIKLGKSFLYHENDYYHSEEYAGYREKYYKAYTHGMTLPKGAFFGTMIPDHQEQLQGLLGFLYYAKTWDIFKRNVCWARLHANEAMFVQALTLTVMHSRYFKGLMMPMIYEIFPQHFFNSKFIHKAEQFDFKHWSKQAMYEKEYGDLMDNSKSNLNSKDWKLWQWWKIMGLSETWYADEQSTDDIKAFWMPVDYTRDLDFMNEESALSYFTEDLDWNAYWYYFHMGYYSWLDEDAFGLKNDRRGEYFAFFVRQILARYALERYSHKLGDISLVHRYKTVKHGYNPQLSFYNGISYSTRSNNFNLKSEGNTELHRKFAIFRKRLNKAIAVGHYTMANGTIVDLRQPESIEFIGNLMQGNANAAFGSYWLQWVYMYFAQDDHPEINYPHTILNYETMLRDPIYYQTLVKLVDHFYLFHKFLKPYTSEELSMPGLVIRDVHISPLITFFDLYDYDVTNLLNDKMSFVDGEFVWDKVLQARQMRLKHKDFHITFDIESDKTQRVVVRTFLAPKYDDNGRVISLAENRKHFWEMDKSMVQLERGRNFVNLTSNTLRHKIGNRYTYTQRYKDIMFNLAESRSDIKLVDDYCGFPERLILPRGWLQGMPMQFYFIITPYTETGHSNEKMCSFGNGSPYIDNRPLGYPFDREINEYEFFTSNMFFKDVKIYHEDLFTENFGLTYKEQFEHFIMILQQQQLHTLHATITTMAMTSNTVSQLPVLTSRHSQQQQQ
ncbi:arylphorin subunit C223-like [Musca vetustissima]|uniref:arylphorin subunit C223-like n=1 Tax=Musca vetustissima TaxID=27455 RepID=UPI002AB6C807|nr:arylphorin subunit C223-like [Musca vetustissima]